MAPAGRLAARPSSRAYRGRCRSSRGPRPRSGPVRRAPGTGTTRRTSAPVGKDGEPSRDSAPLGLDAGFPSREPRRSRANRGPPRKRLGSRRREERGVGVDPSRPGVNRSGRLLDRGPARRPRDRRRTTPGATRPSQNRGAERPENGARARRATAAARPAVDLNRADRAPRPECPRSARCRPRWRSAEARGRSCRPSRGS